MRFFLLKHSFEFTQDEILFSPENILISYSSPADLKWRVSSPQICTVHVLLTTL